MLLLFCHVFTQGRLNRFPKSLFWGQNWLSVVLHRAREYIAHMTKDLGFYEFPRNTAKI